jgi:type VI secretion system secreted protein VgrG
MALANAFQLEIDGSDVAWRVRGVAGTARVHAPWRFELEVAAHHAGGSPVEVPVGDLLGRNARLVWLLADGGERSASGVISEVDTSFGTYRIVVIHKLALLEGAVDHRVFVDQDPIAIVTAVLDEHGLSLENLVHRILPKRAQCVQAFETDLAFVSRLLTEEGIAYYLPIDQADMISVTDHAAGYPDLPGVGPLPVRDRGGLGAGESVYQPRIRQQLVSTRVSLRDYDFKKPELDQSASAAMGEMRLERYEYPGWYEEPSLGKELAQIRLDQFRGRRVILSGKTASRALSAGYVIELESENARYGGRFLLLEVTHRASEGGAAIAESDLFVSEFVAVPAEAGHRPERPAPPRLGGVQTATVTGPSGAEIHSEQYGRVKVHHRWDRERPFDDTSSTWARVVQPPTSGGFLLPRTGWEALVSFHERSADVPLVLGRLYNGIATPPSSLPGKKVVSAFGTMTTPGGGSVNGITLDDDAGNEKMSLAASKDFNEKTENNKNTSVTSTDTWTVGANHNVIVGQVFNQTVGGAQSYAVAGSREVNVTANKVVSAASETVIIGGLRLFNIGGDYITSASSVTRLVGAAKAELGIEHINRAVKGPSTTLVAGSWSVLAGTTNNINVSGASTELIGGAKSIDAAKYYLNVKGAYSETFASRAVDAGGDREEGFSAAASYSIGGATTIKGSDVTVKATAKLTITAGGVTISMTPGSIEISGDFKGDVDAIDDGKVDYE